MAQASWEQRLGAPQRIALLLLNHVKSHSLTMVFLHNSQAGNGAGSSPLNIVDVLTQYRGLSWSVGGNENLSRVTTLANILREFNPSLLGFSTGKGSEQTKNAYLNQAVAGARARDVPSQARRLIDLMKTDSNINFQEDWKLVTLFIGGNDLCSFCKDPVHYSPENFTSNIQTALDLLHKEVPRAFVNLVTILNITSLRKLYQEKKVTCPRLIMRSLCSCVLNPDDNSAEIEMLESFNRMYQEQTHHLVESGRYDTREDFTVVVQPLLEKARMPETPEGLPDSSYFAPDCFHFHQKAHSQAARALWNNMVRHRTELLLVTSLTVSLFCPTVHGLKPADVQVVAALGDSLTVRDPFISSHGFPFLSDILREFNAHLTGYSTATGGFQEPGAFLNQAVPGAKAENLADQVKHLVKLMKTDVRIKFDTDWKIITVFIGVHDLCNYCKDVHHYSAGNFSRYVQEALDLLHAEVSGGCSESIFSLFFKILLHNSSKHNAYFMLLSQISLHKLVETGRYDTKEDFTVVLQPFLHTVALPLLQDGRPDVSFFAPDCLHLSQKAHAQLSRALWNNMVGHRLLQCKNFATSFLIQCMLSFIAKTLSCLKVERWIDNLSNDKVHRLQPADLQVVAALGDSFMVVPSSLPDILKKFNPKLTGFSTGTQKETAGFNVAAEGAMARNLPEQARELVKLMKSSQNINFEKDWKLITILIGSNDLCQLNALCTDLCIISLLCYSIVLCFLPRAFVNMVEIMELTGLRQIKREASGCDRSAMLINSGRYAQREDFAVVVQPFFRNTIMPLDSDGKPDLSFFAVDCFHFSDRGHAEMAMALWNNMLEPVGHKQSYNNFTHDRLKLKCPNSVSSKVLQQHPNPIFCKLPSQVKVVAVAAGRGIFSLCSAVRNHTLNWQLLCGRAALA
uniref:Phospholipase B1, membrane-associated n=1 Tax=Varanus komodoensis TaxID=61221 RepID=A0A8D2IRR7_VARKO